MPSLPHIRASILAACVVFSTQAAVASQADEDNIRQLIQSSEIVPKDYRDHVTIVQKDDTVLISVYKSPDAQQNDCKIDAILMAQKAIEGAPATHLVRVYFFDLTSQDKMWQVDVPTASVTAYAHGSISKADIMRAAKLTSKPANTLASSYSGQSYKQIVQRLGVLAGPAQELRTQALVRIDEMETRGRDVTELKKRYLHIEDLTRRGDLYTMRRELNQLNETLALMQDNTAERETRLNSMSSSSVGASQ